MPADRQREPRAALAHRVRLPDLPATSQPHRWPAVAVAAIGLELPSDPAVTSLSPLHLLVAGSAALVAGFGMLATASLIGYSPTLLAHDLGDDPAGGGRGADPREELDVRQSEYLVVAAAYSTFGWVAGLWALFQAVDASTRPIAIAVFVATMLLAAGVLPVSYAQMRPERTVLGVLPSLRAGWYLLRWPLAKPLAAIARLSLQLLGIRRNEATDSAEVQKQVMAAVADTVNADSLAEAERQWISNIIDLKDRQVSAIMTPRPDIVAFPESLPVREALQRAMDHGFSRYPVYRERIDEVVGIFHVKDALRLFQANAPEPASKTVGTLLRQPLYVPETTGAAELMRQFQSGRQHLAIVIDEYGTTIGLITVEDLLAEIVGEIGDEYDSPPAAGAADEQIRVVEAGRTVELPARTAVARVNELLGSALPEAGDWETVAGLVIAHCNHIPVVGETILVDGVEFRVLEADDRRVRRLRVTLLTPEPAKGA